MTGRRLAVCGAGPVGLEAALYGARLGYDVQVYERDQIGGNVRSWGHVRLFSPWSMNVSPLARRALEEAGSPVPHEGCPLGAELVERYLEPLARLPELAGRVATATRVVAISRGACLKGEALRSPERCAGPFELLIEDAAGERVVEADLVIDACGIYGNHNWLGPGGAPVPGERTAPGISYRLEDYRGAGRDVYAGRRVLVVGAGYSAATAIRDLAALAAEEPGTHLTWATRGPGSRPVPEIPGDPLAERARLAREANALAASGAVAHLPGARIRSIVRSDGELRVAIEGPHGGTTPLPVDRIVALVGYRPDLETSRELHVQACWATEGSMKLAACLLSGAGPGGGDCLSQASPGPESLAMPEPGFLWLGHKSYGRNPAFLMRLGHEQVRDAFRLWESAPDLDLYREDAAVVAGGRLRRAAGGRFS